MKKNFFITLLILTFASLVFAVSGQENFRKYCTQCHGADRALNKSKTLKGWESTVSRMAGKMKSSGLKAPNSEDEESIVNFLVSE